MKLADRSDLFFGTDPLSPKCRATVSIVTCNAPLLACELYFGENVVATQLQRIY